MLDHLRKQVADALAAATQITLATHGAAGLQTSFLPCQAIGTRLYVLVPRTSEHLVNLEGSREIVAVTERWELRGKARSIPLTSHPELTLAQMPAAPWNALVEIRPIRLQIAREEGAGYAATIDIDES